MAAPELDPKAVVREGYDRISFEYRDDAGRGPSKGQPMGRPDYESWLGEVMPLLKAGDPVLDLGCGCGVPATALLARQFAVTGVDLSPVQIARARRLVPAAHFQCADMSLLKLPAGSFAAVVSFYAIIHVPLDEQPGILRNIGRWLRPGGYLLATVGYGGWTGTQDDWLGAPMYWSHADRATYIAWLKETGFEVQWTRFIPEGTGGHTLVLARTSTLPSPNVSNARLALKRRSRGPTGPASGEGDGPAHPQAGEGDEG
jgi:SAM-dependent methyltransferase